MADILRKASVASTYSREIENLILCADNAMDGIGRYYKTPTDMTFAAMAGAAQQYAINAVANPKGECTRAGYLRIHGDLFDAMFDHYTTTLKGHVNASRS